MASRSNRVLPGFGLSLGYTLVYLSLIVLIPLAAVFVMITGVIGAIVGPSILRLCRVHHPAAQGMALGITAHAVGTARALQEALAHLSTLSPDELIEARFKRLMAYGRTKEQ